MKFLKMILNHIYWRTTKENMFLVWVHDKSDTLLRLSLLDVKLFFLLQEWNSQKQKAGGFTCILLQWAYIFLIIKINCFLPTCVIVHNGFTIRYHTWLYMYSSTRHVFPVKCYLSSREFYFALCISIMQWRKKIKHLAIINEKRNEIYLYNITC